MAVLTFKSTEFKTFPPIMKEYASYSTAIKGNSEKTVCEYLLDLRTFFRYVHITKNDLSVDQKEFEKIGISKLGVSDFESINTQIIVDFLMYAGYERENNTTTRLRKLSAIKSFFHYLYTKKHLITSNPAADIEGPKKAKTLPKYLSTNEAIVLLETVKNDIESKTRIRDYAIITLFLNTGMRLSELVGLNLQSLDRDLESVKVRGKGNKERIVYLNSAAKEAVADYLRLRLDPTHVRTDSNALFLSRRENRISNKTVQWLVGKYFELSGLGSKGYSVHKLRHTAATLMYQSGKVDIRVLKEILGHEQLNTTQIYTHVVNQSMQDAMKQNPLSEVFRKAKK